MNIMTSLVYTVLTIIIHYILIRYADFSAERGMEAIVPYHTALCFY